jgi:hypothetical protein
MLKKTSLQYLAILGIRRSDVGEGTSQFMEVSLHR